ncbi:MAG TPA: hypothetical protein VEI26_13265 [Terriglobales bacterium]|nr:hypothetical protein [Terriglobales bacterium]
MFLSLMTLVPHSEGMLWLTDRVQLGVILVIQSTGSFLQEGSLFNILIALVFGFSTLNILALASKGFDSRPARLKPGEILAITAMVLSVCFLGWEMLHVFHVFPIHLGD